MKKFTVVVKHADGRTYRVNVETDFGFKRAQTEAIDAAVKVGGFKKFDIIEVTVTKTN